MIGLQFFIDFMVASSVLLIAAMGLFLVFGLYRVVNMAHGEFVLLGGYVAAQMQSTGAPFAVCVLAAAVVVGFASLVLDAALIGRQRLSSSLTPLLATWGVGLLISQGIRLIMGPTGVSVTDPVGRSFEFAGSVYSVYQLILVFIAIILALSAWILIHRTKIGLRVRAQVTNETLSELHGVNTRLQFSTAFFIGGMLAGAAGALLAPLAAINPSSGSSFSISSFMVVIMGGMNHVAGQVSGALVMGGGRNLIGTFSSVTIATLATLLIVALILAFRGKDDLVD